LARCQWLTPVILATQEAEIKRNSSKPTPANISKDSISKKKKKKKKIITKKD
jgi:hypothetical protein